MSVTITFWDVQHGNAAYINTPNGTDIVVDLGVGSFDNSDETFSPLRHLKSDGVQSLDGVIITHPHTDHVDDIFNFDSMSPKVLRRPRHLTEQDIRDVQSGNNPFDAANNGGVTFQSFYPQACGRSNLNNHSIVTIVSHAGVKVLIPGDNQNPSWNELLLVPAFVAAVRGTHVLLAPHHGRDEGFCEALFDAIGPGNPLLTIVSDGSLCDTSAHDRYRAKTYGWDVRYNNGEKKRYCLTTNADGLVRIEIGQNSDGRGFLGARIYRDLST